MVGGRELGSVPLVGKESCRGAGGREVGGGREFWRVTLVGRDLVVLEWYIGRGRGVLESYILE